MFEASILDFGAVVALFGFTVSVLLARFVPQLNSFLYYGKVDGARLVDITVPKSWFRHFYIWSLALCVIQWAVGIHTKALGLMTVQSVRRVYECFFVERASQARMHAAHYLVGLAFYTIQALAVSKPSKLSMVSLILFIGSSIVQSDAHVHLASLVKYSVPIARLFRVVACPHYTAEIGIYWALAIVTKWHVVSTMSLVWVFVNLSVSAEQSWRFYSKSDPHPPYAILPGVF